MYRRILVPIDGSTASLRGLEQALDLARDGAVRLRLLHVLDERLMMPAVDGYVMPDMTSFIEALRNEGARALADAAAMARRKRVAADTALIESGGRSVSDVILDEARKWKADLLVMGTHGRRGLNRLILGSDAERVLREAFVPVLLVRSGGESGARPARRRARARKSPQRALRA
jgi:nucleotide-binding universal stress UspA family protein